LQSSQISSLERNTSFSSDVIKLETDRGVFSNHTTTPLLMAATARQLEFRYTFGSAGDEVKVGVSLIYRLEPDKAFSDAG
jgi:hypothetical protein